MDFLEDPDEGLRLAALKVLPIVNNRELAGRLSAIAADKSFRSKSKEEKAAVLNALAKIRTEDTCAVFCRLLRKRVLFGRSKTLETRLAVVHALERMATSSAVKALRDGQRVRPRLLRNEIRDALRATYHGLGMRTRSDMTAIQDEKIPELTYKTALEILTHLHIVLKLIMVYEANNLGFMERAAGLLAPRCSEGLQDRGQRSGSRSVRTSSSSTRSG